MAETVEKHRTCFPAQSQEFDLVEVSIIRENGNSPIKVEVFGMIADFLISIAEANPTL